MAARQGFEPRQKEPESFVLPLHHRANANIMRIPPKNVKRKVIIMIAIFNA